MLAVAHGDRSQRRCVGARLRLGQAEGAELAPGGQRTQPAFLLFVVAPGEQDRADERVDGDDGGGRSVAGGDLFEHHRQRAVIEPGAAPSLGNHDAVAAERSEAGERLRGEGRFAIPARGVGRDLAAHELAHGVADHLLVFVQQHGSSVGLSRKITRCGRRALALSISR